MKALWSLVCTMILVTGHASCEAAPAEKETKQAMSENQAKYRDAALPIEQRIHDLVSRMTLEEKARQMDMYAGRAVRTDGEYDDAKAAAVIGDLGMGSIHDLYPPTAELANTLQRHAVERSRLGIPILFIEEGLHGIFAKGYTVFPQAIGLASTWNPDLAQEVGSAIAAEARACGVHMLLCPVLDLAWDPRWGRTEETYGEDPYLASRFAVAMVRGLQGDALTSDRSVVAEPKHFAAHGMPEGGRNCAPVRIGRRELHESLLPVFQAAFQQGGARAVMSAYHEIDGVPCTGNRWLLTDLLRDTWGFNGFVLTDLGAIRMLEDIHKTAASPRDAIRQAIHAGVDMQFYDYENDAFQRMVVELVRDGQLDIADVDRAVSSILRVKFELGLFDKPYADASLVPRVVHCEDHRRLALKVAREAICLLKNEGDLLPLSKEIKTIAVVGPSADVPRLGDYTVRDATGVTVLQAIEHAVSPQTKIEFMAATDILGVPLTPIPSRCLVPPDGRGHGLRGEYFDNFDLKGDPVVVRVDSQVDFDWSYVAPVPTLALDKYSVRWTGTLIPDRTVDGHVGTTSDDGVRLWIDRELMIDEWYDHAPAISSRPIRLEAGRLYDIRLEYYQRWGAAVASLGWNVEDAAEVRDRVTRMAGAADVVIAVVGESFHTCGEAFDRADLGLPGQQQALIETVHATGTPVVVVLLNGRPLGIPWVARHVPAIIEAWYPGEAGGTAIADVLFGDYNPAGRLPITVPKSVGQLPLHYHHKRSARRNYVSLSSEPLYPFGHGLSYTGFAYSDLTVRPTEIRPGETVDVTVTVTNTGTRAGDEVVQLYVRDDVSSVTKPERQLRGVERVHLEPGAVRQVEFTLGPEDMVVLDERYRSVVEPGTFTVLVGGSSRASLVAQFEVTNSAMHRK